MKTHIPCVLVVFAACAYLVCAIIFFRGGGFNNIAIELAIADGNRIYVTVA